MTTAAAERLTGRTSRQELTEVVARHRCRSVDPDEPGRARGTLRASGTLRTGWTLRTGGTNRTWRALRTRLTLRTRHTLRTRQTLRPRRAGRALRTSWSGDQVGAIPVDAVPTQCLAHRASRRKQGFSETAQEGGHLVPWDVLTRTVRGDGPRR